MRVYMGTACEVREVHTHTVNATTYKINKDTKEIFYPTKIDTF
jgi:hypothetical protein